MNTCCIKGNISQDIETRFLPNGNGITEFSVAVNKKWTTESGEKKEKVSFIPCKCWGKRGEVIAQYFTKGSAILLRGELDMEQWEDKATQQKRSKLVLFIEEFDFCGDKRQEGQPTGQPPRQQQRPAPSGQRLGTAPVRGQQQAPPKLQDVDYGDGPVTDGLDDDEIPF
jgi:single-strand DNA-binding protein